MTDHDISALLSKLDIITQSIKDSDARSANRHMALHHEVTTLSREVRDTQERVSALERDKTRHSGFIRAQSESHHEIIVEQRELEKAHEKLEEDHRKVKGMFERVTTQMATPQNTVIGFLILTFRDDVRHYVEAIVKFIGSLFGN